MDLTKGGIGANGWIPPMMNINDWNWTEPHPELELAEIELTSSRAMALLLRNRSRPVLQTHLMQIIGAIEMIEGMEYHHDAFRRLHRRVAWGSAVNELHLRHEAVAYLNRLGQFVVFARSDLARSIGMVAVDDIPTMEGLMIFRHKYTAHLSIDAPRNGDTPSLQHSHARAFSSTFGSLFNPRPNRPRIDIHRLPKPFDLRKFRQQIWRSGFLVFQMAADNDGASVNFSLEEQHPAIMGEAYRAIERVITTDQS